MASITKEENNGFRVIKSLNLCGRRVLHTTFSWGTPDKPSCIKLDDYLNNLHHTSSANYLKVPRSQKRFNKTQKKLINMSPDGTEFDIPLLYLSIKLACENVAAFSDPKWIDESTEMEYYITAINNVRNVAVHTQLAVPDDDYLEIIRKLRELLTGCLKASGERYGQNMAEVDKEIKQMNDNLDYIMNEILGEEDIIRFCSDDIKQIIINDSCEKLNEIFQKIVYIDPLSFINKNLKIRVDKIFVNIDIVKGHPVEDGSHVDFCELFKLVQTTSVPSSVSCVTERPQILLLEGLAGSGKTTLVTLVIQEWIQGGQSQIKGLDNYDLLLWVQCRDTTMNSFQDLLDRLISDVSAKFRKVLPRIIKLCKVLIIVDGLDELNNNSRSLLQSLLFEFQNSSYTTFMCTSRPEKIEMFRMTIPEGYEVTDVELRGIVEDDMKEFVSRIHQEITKHTMSNRRTEELVNNLANIYRLYDHLRLPMNLTFLVYIWDQAPDQFDITTITQTELYHKIHDLCQNKLLERLANCPKTKAMDKIHLKRSIQEILKLIYMTSLESLSREQLTLEEDTVERLIAACKEHDIPYEEMLSAFLSLKPIWTWQGIEERYSAPHKGIQDFFSALHIVMLLNDQLQSSAVPVLYTQHPTPPVSFQAPTISASISPITPPPTSALPTSALPTPVLPTPALPTQAAFSSSPPPTLAISTSSGYPTQASPTPTSRTLVTPVSISRVLEQCVRGASEDMTKYNNVLLHVAGLLYLLLDQVPETIAQEVVHLFHKSGGKNKYKFCMSNEDEEEAKSRMSYEDEEEDKSRMSNEDEEEDKSRMSDEDEDNCIFNGNIIPTDNDKLLDFLENTKCNEDIARAVSRLFSTSDVMLIKDNRLRSCMALLPHMRPLQVNISVEVDLPLADLLDLIDVLATHNHRCTRLELDHHYLHDDATTTSDEILQRLQPRWIQRLPSGKLRIRSRSWDSTSSSTCGDDLVMFRGHLSGDGVSLLPGSLKYLYLTVVSDDHARRLLPQLQAVVTSTLSRLYDLNIKMSVGVSTAALVSLPRTRKWVTLYLTDMSDIDVSHACEVFQKLQPPGGYRNIICEFSKLTMEGIQDVIHGLADHSVTVKQWLTVTTTVTINEEQHEQLCNMATETLACDFLINAS